MNIVIPTSNADKHLLINHARVLAHFGGLEEHRVLIHAAQGAKEEAYEAAKLIGAQVHVVDINFAGGWPHACNAHFASVVFALGRTEGSEPFLWMEPDMLPRVKGWPNLLAQEYRARGMPFMGNVVPTPFADNGEITFKHGDTMMMGCGIYPANMDKDERFKPLILDLAKTGSRAPRDAFDVYLRWGIRNAGVADTHLIADMWQTCNYRHEGNQLVCDPMKVDRVVRQRGGVVSASAILIHGCKDNSLAQLLLGGKTFVLKTALEKPPVEIVSGNTADDDLDWIDGPKSPEKTPEPSAAPVMDSQDEDAPAPEKIDTSTHHINREVINAAIKSHGTNGNIQSKKLAKALSITHQELVGAVFPRQGYMAMQGGWVKSTI